MIEKFETLNQSGFGMRPFAQMDSAEIGELQDLKVNGKFGEAIARFYKHVVCNEYGYPLLNHPRSNMAFNSILRKDEWEEMDRAVVEESHDPMNAVQRLINLGLVQQLGGPGTLISQWNVISEMTRAEVSVEGVTKTDMDIVDHLLKGVTVPVVHKRFDITMRSLEASRRMGDGIDTTNAREATRIVTNEWEYMFFAGNTTVNLNGNPIYGVTTETNINTGAASGDFGTISNIYPTFVAMANANAADNYWGPMDCWVATTQYNEMQDRYSDGSGQSPLTSVGNIAQVRDVFPSARLTAGTLVCVTMVRDVIDLALIQTPTLVEWMSPDGMMNHFKVIAMGVPRVKSTYSGRSGIAYYTGA